MSVEQYRDKREALIDGYRKEFGNENMPFIVNIRLLRLVETFVTADTVGIK
jgi:hypothetical protein